eukprot:Pgem_evm1s4878
MPTDYSRAERIYNALNSIDNNCWEWKPYSSILVKTCSGLQYNSVSRFDLTDGPQATRTGEEAIITSNGRQFAFVNIHWDHQSWNVRNANAQETANQVNANGLPTVTVGDFNTDCYGDQVGSLIRISDSTLVHSHYIDCILASGGFQSTGETETINT